MRHVIKNGFLPGLVIGSIAALLFAPDEGTYTRKKIMRGFRRTQDNLGDKRDDFDRKLAQIKKDALASIDSVGQKFMHKTTQKEV